MHFDEIPPFSLLCSHSRHRRVMNLEKNLVRLNEFPEWFTVDENTLYRIGRGGTPGQVRLGSELIAGITLDPGEWIVESLRGTREP